MEFAEHFFKWLWEILDIPAILLFAMMGLFAYALHKSAQDRTNRFKFADLFLDDQGKASVGRIGNFICALTSGWIVVYMAIKSPDSDSTRFTAMIFMLVFSGQRVAEKLIDVWGTVRTGGNNVQANQKPSP